MSRAAGQLVAGWSRTRISLPPESVVLDVGCGAFPNARADIACDRSLSRTVTVRVDRRSWIDRSSSLTQSAYRFAATASTSSSPATSPEHVAAPEVFCAELQRVARGGYIETPSPLADALLDEEYHIWRVSGRRNEVVFRAKLSKRRFTEQLADLFYSVFYAASVRRQAHSCTALRPSWAAF